MYLTNQTQRPRLFILVGVPGLEYVHIWLSIPLFIMFVMIMLGNFVVSFVILSEEKLYKPMYLLLTCLCISDMLLAITTTPKILGIFWFGSKVIGFSACLAQLFFIHTFSIIGSTTLLAMSFDRYVAICHPLRYTTILNNATIIKITVFVIIEGSMLTAPTAILAQRLPYCRTNIISHTYCEHMAVVKIACKNTAINRVYGLIVALLVIGVDMILISISYCAIGRAVHRLSSKEARQKAMSTCVPHICVILIAYIPALYSFLAHRFGHGISTHVHIIFANLYILIPPMSHPIIYGARNKEIHEKILPTFCAKTFKSDGRPT